LYFLITTKLKLENVTPLEVEMTVQNAILGAQSQEKIEQTKGILWRIDTRIQEVSTKIMLEEATTLTFSIQEIIPGGRSSSRSRRPISPRLRSVNSTPPST
jgi:hypothetical protein